MMKYFVLISIALLTFNNLYGNINDSTYSKMIGYKIGEKPGEYLKDPVKDGSLYFFYTDKNCYSCLAHMKHLNKILSKNFNLNVYAFFCGMTQYEANKFKEENNINFPVIGDKLYLYQEYFKINVLPQYILLGKFGELLAHDKCGGVRYEDWELIEFIKNQSIKKATNFYGLDKLKEIDRIAIKDGDNYLKIDDNYFVSFFPYDSTIIILNKSIKNIILLNSKFNVIKKISLKDLINKSYKPRSPFYAYFAGKNLICLTDLDRDMHTNFGLFNINKLKLQTVNYIYPYPPYNLEKAEFNRVNNLYVCSINPMNINRENVILNDTINTLVLIDTNGREIKKFGKPDDIFQRLKISKIFGNKYFIDGNGNIYEIQDASKNLCIFNKSGEMINKLNLKLGNSFRIPKSNLESSGDTFKDWMEWNSKVSYFKDFTVDGKNNKIFITYLTVDYPKGVVDPLSAKSIEKNYIYMCDIDGKPLLKDDIQIPVNSKVIDYNSKILTLLEVIEGKMYIVKYSLETALNKS